MIPLKQVTSSAIAAHGYDLASRTLAIEFRSGGRHDFRDVPPEVADQFAAHSSPGTAYHSLIRGKFDSAAAADDGEGSAAD